MKAPRTSLDSHALRIFICIAIVNCQEPYLICAPAQALVKVDDALSFADLGKLAECEQNLFSNTHKSLPSEQRVQALEKEVFGAPRTGALAVRIANLYQVLGIGKKDLLLPPLAGQLDHESVYSNNQGAPAIAPQASENDREEGPTPAPNRSKSLLRQALQYYHQGKIDLAERTFHQVIAIDKTNSDSYFNLGAIAEGRGNLTDALSYYRSAATYNPNDTDATDAVVAVEKKIQALKANGMDAQTASNQAMAQSKDDDLRKRVAVAAAAYKEGDYDSAINILRGVAQQAPNEPDVQYALSQAYKGKGQYLDARTALQAALAISPNNQMYRSALSDLDRLIANGGTANSLASAPESFSNSASQDNGSAGQITPFSHDGFDSQFGQQAANQGYWPEYASQNGQSSTTRRIERAAIGTISGAAIGSMFGGGYYGRGRGTSALTGALMGGMLGLFMGH